MSVNCKTCVWFDAALVGIEGAQPCAMEAALTVPNQTIVGEVPFDPDREHECQLHLPKGISNA